jgi:pimeloyl-ACP methyl ester carboxylesterase
MKEFYIDSDGIRLHAKLDQVSEKGPLCILIHGFTGHIEETHIVAVSKGINAVGIATLRADMYGHGHSDGEFKKHTLFKWMTNVLTVIDYARALDFVTDIYLCGHSQGGLLVMLAAAMKHDVIRGLIPLSPAWMIPEIARKGELLGEQFDPDHIPESLDFWNGHKLDANYVRVAQTIRVDDAIARYAGPVLVVHGDEDESVPLRCGVEAAHAYRDAKLVIIPGDDHCYTRHLDQVVDAVKTWLEERR